MTTSGDSTAAAVGDPSLYAGDGSMPPDVAQAGLESVGLGVAKGAFATKDFFATGMGIWGDTPAEKDRSSLRQWVDSESSKNADQFGFGYSLSEGLAQGAVALVGAGKLKALGSVAQAGITALRGAAAFEPHAANLFNIADKVPGLSGPLTNFLASDQGDSTFKGYMKNALSSLGIEGAVVGLVTGTASMVKALRSGDDAAVTAAQGELQRAVSAQGREAASKWDNLGRPMTPEETAQFHADIDSGRYTPPDPHDTGAGAGDPGATQRDLVERGRLDTELGGAEPSPSSQASPLSSSSPTSSMQDGTSGPAGAGEPGTPAGSSPSASSGTATGPAPVPIDEGALSRAINSAVDDQKALIKHGSWDAAVAAGHTFGGEDHMPWQFTSGENTGNAETSLDAFTARVRDSFRAQYDDAKGGDVQTDAMNQQAVQARVALWNEDPATLLGALTAAGKRAGDLRADMQATFTIAQRLMQDSWTMASRIKMGLLDEWGGSQDAAYAALKQQMGVTVQAHQAALSFSSNAGRALRGLRGDQKLTPGAVGAVNPLGPMELGNLGKVEGSDLVDLLTDTKGDPMAMAAALKPGLIQWASEGAQLLLVNNLISNPITHAIIFGSNLWQAAARPAMRVAGSLANGSWDTVGRNAAKSYWYMGTAVPDALNMAYKAFQLGDSVIAPHDLSSAMGAGSGGAASASSIGQAIAQANFKSWDSVGNIFSNTLLAMAKTGTFPTRMVGVQDELVKQVVYRGKVLANAALEGTGQGLKGADLEAFMKSKLYDSFDQYGQATDKFALNEAKVATYQNDLNPTGSGGFATQGYALQQFLQNNPPARIIVPFMRTPVNLFRQGVQLTPGLNMVQKEYRDAITGVARDGETPEQTTFRQAQALGQMGMGSMLMGSAGMLAYQGFVTGDAPSNPKLAAEAMADGWRPNSIVITKANGSKTYIPFDRYDPIMMPMAMAANIVSVLKSPDMADQNKAQSMLQALSVALIKQLTDKLYLQNFKQTLEAVQDPDKNLGKWAGGMAGNYVPASSALHLINPDPIMRDAHDFLSAMLGKVPGFSKDFPARRDWAGDPVSVHKGLWLDAPGDAANQEVERLALQQGASVGAPSSRAKGEADLRDITLAGNADPGGKGMNAYDRFQELAGHPERMPGGNPTAKPLRQAATDLINSAEYKKMPDGDPGTKGTKVATLMGLVNSYREGARKFMASDNNVRAQEYSETMRVAKANGYVTPNMPTPTNTADGMINRLGKMFGFSGAHAPSPAAPTTQGAPQQQ